MKRYLFSALVFAATLGAIAPSAGAVETAIETAVVKKLSAKAPIAKPHFTSSKVTAETATNQLATTTGKHATEALEQSKGFRRRGFRRRGFGRRGFRRRGFRRHGFH